GSRQRGQSSGGMTMAQLLIGDMLRRSAVRFPNRPAVLADGASIDYATLDARANRIAHALLKRGMGPGSKVAILAANRLDYAAIYFGAARSGVMLAHLSVRYTPADIAFVLGKADVDLVFVEAGCAGTIEEARPRLKQQLKHVVVFGGPAVGDAIALDDFIEGQPDTPPEVAIEETAPYAVTFT